jgi:ribose/xylose/arabinose/galactoside ABC-type transport system permease subunit
MRFRVVPGWSAAVILVLEFLFFTLILWRPGESHTFANAENVALIFKYSGIYGISAIGAAMIIGRGRHRPCAGSGDGAGLGGDGRAVRRGAVAAAGGDCGGAERRRGERARWRRPWSSAPACRRFIATLGTMGIARGLAFVITEGRFYDLSRWLAAGTAPLGIPLAAWPGTVMIALAIVFQVVMVRTALGRHVLATGGNETAARYAGVHVDRVKAFVYVTGGALAAMSGVVLAVVQGRARPIWPAATSSTSSPPRSSAARPCRGAAPRWSGP